LAVRPGRGFWCHIQAWDPVRTGKLHESIFGDRFQYAPGAGTPVGADIHRPMALIYRKSAKGLSEIETRAHRLPPRLRSALIVVDGRRDVNELRPLILQQPDETLAALAEQGFIEAVGESAPPPPAPVAAPAPAPAPTPAAAAGSDFDATRRAAVRALNDLIGPAAETIAMKMEKARNLSELMPLLTQAAQAVAAMRGRAAAEAFAQRFGIG
jgi:hypothetical protein